MYIDTSAYNSFLFFSWLLYYSISCLSDCFITVVILCVVAEFLTSLLEYIKIFYAICTFYFLVKTLSSPQNASLIYS